MMIDDQHFQEWKDISGEATVGLLADIALLSQDFPAAGARAKEQFINKLVQRMYETGYQPKT